MKRLETLASQKRIDLIRQEFATTLPNFIRFLGFDPKPPSDSIIRVQILCNWTTTQNLMNIWKKFTPNESLMWRNMKLVDSNPDYWIIINKPFDSKEMYEPERTIVCQMEPNMKDNPMWGEWRAPDSSKFMKVLDHTNSVNPLEWHLGSNYNDLLDSSPTKTHGKVVSAILSDRYVDPGQIKRVDFVKALEKHTDVHVYGNNKFGYAQYKGALPYHNKNDGLMPYKYTIAAENNAIPNYCTEKIVDAILSESLCFYWGCPNLEQIIDPRTFIRLDMEETDVDIVIEAINNDEWEKRIDIIRQEKRRILTKLQLIPFFHELFKN